MNLDLNIRVAKVQPYDLLKIFLLSDRVSATLGMKISDTCANGFGDGSGALQRGQHVLGEKAVYFRGLPPCLMTTMLRL
ncbi:hypothetical protein K443DRAFT_362709 [Laccaria amethystina LaAM-08-1]|uniref:Unplaced genomic scaffold K443scaffold_262, whole genome shotgun sequence n=1 Tax=Laccaria amethystina LaAM-08-1 TaxID=1095629 RepID=A0A0C9X9I6_9AGAR|nr:hypothetical protein K443DRAFT_362709 [Laccaria amethystina LaAM-08-1]